jgi:hypothetical protein
MNISIVTVDESVEVPLNEPVSIVPTPDGTSFAVARRELIEQALVLFRPDARSVVVMPRAEAVAVSVNGLVVRGGLGRAQNTAVISMPGARPIRFGLLFDDAVVSVAAGEPCDICGQQMTEEGKSHCRKRMCRACIEVFGGTCPDCRKSLLNSSDCMNQTAALREFLIRERR